MDRKPSMERRYFLALAVTLPAVGLAGGCRGHQYGHVLDAQDADMVGSHQAGSEIYKPLIDEAVASLLGQCQSPYQQVGTSEALPLPERVCFVGVENLSSEELGDFKDQIYQLIDAQLIQSQAFDPVSRRYVDAALNETQMRMNDLFVPKNQRALAAVLERQGQPLDYMLFATVTSGTTQSNKSYQRDYLLTLEMIDLRTGRPFKSQATLRKGYHPSKIGKFRFYNPWARNE